MLHAHRAVELARNRDIIGAVEFVLGDCSSERVFDEAALKALRAQLGADVTLKYEFFGKNLGTARGHNTMFEGCKADFVVVMNPDVLMSPDCLIELFRPFRIDITGMVEARQLPIEHPKDYNSQSGETSWASTACCLIPSRLWRELHGFDADTFFLYCDDVDFSWRVRLQGYKVVFQPSAVAFHDKRLTTSGSWPTSAAERYFSAEAALMLAHKYSRPDVVAAISKDFSVSREPHIKKALATFKERRKKGKLCEPIDPHHIVGEFVHGAYANYRFQL
ncbi:MAG: glycosyltransferase [Archangium sp.]